MPSVKTWRELLRTPSMRSSQNSPSETVWKSGIALSSGCHLWVKGCGEALFGRLQRSDEDDGDPLQLFSKQFLHALGCIMDQGVWEIGIEREQSRGSRPSLLVGFVVGVVVGFDGAFAVFSM